MIDDPALARLRAARAARAATAGEPAAFEQLLYEEDGPLARITLNRPERRNALSMQLSEELVAALELVQTLGDGQGARDPGRGRHVLRRR